MMPNPSIVRTTATRLIGTAALFVAGCATPLARADACSNPLATQEGSESNAAGLLLLVMAQIVIDRYSEQRAATYLDQISHHIRPR
jgi:hypothetical protein